VEVRFAVASSDGKTVNAHFGRSAEFMIYLLAQEGYRYVETRRNTPACGMEHHNDDRLAASAALLSDCRGVLVGQIGPGAIDVLVEWGVLPFTMSGDIGNALRVVINSGRFALDEKLPVI